jgi:predicted solute-binding protein
MEANKTVLQMKYARIVNLFAKETGMPLEDALSFFYNSATYELISEGIADLHCRSDEYLAEELMLEYKENSK